MSIFSKNVKCITCQKEIEKKKALKEYDLYFCSQDCLKKYKEHLNSIEKDFNLDNCC